MNIGKWRFFVYISRMLYSFKSNSWSCNKRNEWCLYLSTEMGLIFNEDSLLQVNLALSTLESSRDISVRCLRPYESEQILAPCSSSNFRLLRGNLRAKKQCVKSSSWRQLVGISRLQATKRVQWIWLRQKKIDNHVFNIQPENPKL